jgi:hypothetical protein
MKTRDSIFAKKHPKNDYLHRFFFLPNFYRYRRKKILRFFWQKKSSKKFGWESQEKREFGKKVWLGEKFLGFFVEKKKFRNFLAGESAQNSEIFLAKKKFRKSLAGKVGKKEKKKFRKKKFGWEKNFWDFLSKKKSFEIFWLGTLGPS